MTAAIAPDILERARELYQQGKSRADIEYACGIGRTTAYELTTRFAMEEKMAESPAFLANVKQMVDQGLSRFDISKACQISLTAAQFMIQLAKTSLHEDDIQFEDEEAIQLRKKLRERREAERKDLVSRVGRLLDDGEQITRIADMLGLSLDHIESIVQEVRQQGFTQNRMMGKQEKFQVIDRMLDEGKSSFAVARALDVSPGTAQKLVKRVRGTLDLNADAFRHAVARGSTLKQLINRFGVRDAQEVSSLIEELFPDHLCYSKDIGDGDLWYTLIPDKSDHFKWLHADRQQKRFRWAVSEEANYMFVRMDDDVSEMKIYNFTDVHVGHKHFNEDRFRSHIEMVARDPNAFFVCGGDMFEWAHKHSVGDPWEQVLSPMEQTTRTARLLLPIAHKGLAYVPGNHDKGRGKMVGADLAEVVANMLHIPYFKVETVMQLALKDKLFTLALDHGRSGSTIQAILKDAEKYKEKDTFFVHAHMSGHVHNSQVIKRIMRDLEPGVGFKFKRTYTIIGGSYLDYTGTYAEEAKYTPTPQDLTYFACDDQGGYYAGALQCDPK